MLWRDLLRSTNRVSPTSIDNAKNFVHCRNFEVNYSKGTNYIQFYGVITGSHGTPYSVMIAFTNMSDDQGLMPEEVMAGVAPRPSLKNNDVQVRCNCPSYRYTGAVGNYHQKLHTGPKFGRFIPAKTNRAGRNPNELPMVCKHIIEFMNYLIDEGYVVD